jgi:hypothetical protein
MADSQEYYIQKGYPFFNGEIKTFQNNNQLKLFMSTNSVLQKILKLILHVEEKESHKHKIPEKNNIHKENG